MCSFHPPVVNIISLLILQFYKRECTGWSGDMSHIYDEFIQSPEEFMNQYPGGDQDFINDGGHSPVFWQDILPNHIQSYKVHVRRNDIHKDCRVVAFHGNPRPWAIDELVKEQRDECRFRIIE